ncbi:MAG: NADH-quinone oxidoreductase subunit C [Candidatus Omnitrophica bacterium]|nr:NADH-quinone oxidoreductase subunit C [Candidatus Omnitrophota bacterium]
MNIVEQIKAGFSQMVIEAFVNHGEATVVVKKENVLVFAQGLKKDPALDFDMLIDLFGVDYLHWEDKADRFEVVYHLYSSRANHRLFIKVSVPESDAAVDTVTGVWPAADWYEREVWDMFGIVFRGHPNLKRILMYEEFRGHPLRKDYAYNQRQPLIGPRN